MLEIPWSAVGNPTSAFGPSGSSFGSSSLAPIGIHHVLLNNVTTACLRLGSATADTCTRSAAHLRSKSDFGNSLHDVYRERSTGRVERFMIARLCPERVDGRSMGRGMSRVRPLFSGLRRSVGYTSRATGRSKCIHVTTGRRFNTPMSLEIRQQPSCIQSTLCTTVGPAVYSKYLPPKNIYKKY